jgi:hypothetical protein
MSFGMTGEISVPLADYRRRNAWLWAAQDAAHERCGVRILDPCPICATKAAASAAWMGALCTMTTTISASTAINCSPPCLSRFFAACPGKLYLTHNFDVFFLQKLSLAH